MSKPNGFIQMCLINLNDMFFFLFNICPTVLRVKCKKKIDTFILKSESEFIALAGGCECGI